MSPRSIPLFLCSISLYMSIIDPRMFTSRFRGCLQTPNVALVIPSKCGEKLGTESRPGWGSLFCIRQNQLHQLPIHSILKLITSSIAAVLHHNPRIALSNSSST
ncbi:uncharacterized protein BO72DRAFT_25258 [Aspergillus fijiensis CBS 313.89]|uniref:Uncharacterized protein n=1 Tax=Aspergillus fijiensis CBS 313.89 TaxID=1448319 RepID=A0A8G1W0J2_9EURO|nr:uncharacterized protein BO72DRAFT_25258 [Aspergillus fijiensis CBS 313.89]RAK79965.1 hypothetical protein BO72DRAFT_25258 [Aspergillus fijiensis CBS 313.89]